jgi:hypothetical protein
LSSRAGRDDDEAVVPPDAQLTGIAEGTDRAAAPGQQLVPAPTSGGTVVHPLAGVTQLKLQPAGCLTALDAGGADPEVPGAYCSRVPASPPAAWILSNCIYRALALTYALPIGTVVTCTRWQPTLSTSPG